MSLNPNRMLVIVTDAAGANYVFPNASAVSTTSQDVTDELNYLAFRDLAEGKTFSEGICSDIAETLALGASIHD